MAFAASFYSDFYIKTLPNAIEQRYIMQ